MSRRTAAVLALVAVLLAPATAPPVGAAPAAGPAAARSDGAEVIPATWRQVDTGQNHTCGIGTNGRLYCWGRDVEGQAGNGAVIVTGLDEVVGGHADWTSVSAGSTTTCGIRAGGRLFCWGGDDDGQLGNGVPLAAQTVPRPVAGGHTDWVEVSVGSRHVCGRRATGRLFCWGSDVAGQVGNNPSTATPRFAAPVQVAGGHTDWRQVSAGQEHTCGRRANGRLYCWGNDFDGLLGDGATLTPRPTPVPVAGGHTDWTSVSAGANHTCGRRAGGRPFCWGSDFWSQLGTSAVTAFEPTPVEVDDGAVTGWGAPQAGGRHSCAVRAGRLFCWGTDIVGQLGDGAAVGPQALPVEVAGSVTTWRRVVAGGDHTCALRMSGSLWCWGNNDIGQVGDGFSGGTYVSPRRVG